VTPFLGSSNLPEQLTELNKLVSPLDYQFLMKGVRTVEKRRKEKNVARHRTLEIIRNLLLR